MRYLEIKIHASTPGVEVITALLEAYGVTAVSVEDPKDVSDMLGQKGGYAWDYYEPSLLGRSGEDAVLAFYLEDSSENSALISEIRGELLVLASEPEAYGAGFSFGSLEMETSIRSDDEWKDNWKAYFKPFKLTGGIWVRPSWEPFEPENRTDRVITLDPGMAFGTGKHETTAMCAELLAATLKPGMSMLDVGCGSGILLLAACLLGAGEVLGTEIDDDAIVVAKENVAINGLESNAGVMKADLLAGVAYEADVITANLTVDLAARLLDDVRNNLKPGGVLLISGILTDKRQKIEAALAAKGFAAAKTMERGEWLALAAVPQD